MVVCIKRTRAEPDEDKDWYRRCECGRELEPPSQGPDSVEDEVGAEANKDTKRDPELEAHDKTSSDGGGRRLRGHNGDSGNFYTHAYDTSSISKL